MKLLKRGAFIFATLAMAGCGAPQINVKKEWTKSILSYSFIPLYPMREDVFVGDIRIHRLDANQGSGLHSRPLGRLNGIDKMLSERTKNAPPHPKTMNAPNVNGNQFRWVQNTQNDLLTGLNRLRLMALPGITVTQISDVDASVSGLLGLWKTVIGTNFDREETTFVSLTGLETVEIADHQIAKAFRDHAKAMLDNEDKRLGICVAAIAMGDPRFEKTAISVLTRVAYARGAEFRRKSDSRISTNLSAENAENSETDKASGNAVSQTTKALTLNEVFDRPLAFGVDALMIDPTELYGAPNSLADVCKKEAAGFEVSPASAQLTGARQRTVTCVGRKGCN